MSDKSAFELDQELATRLTSERAHTVETILLIAEIDRRQTFVELGFSSTWDYLRRVHGQSDTMIHYRLTCARATRRFPQVIAPLRDGRLCMTSLAKLMEVMNEANCDDLLAEALGKSKRQVKRIVAREKPQPIPTDITRSLVPAQVVDPLPASTTSALPAARSIAAEQPVRTEMLTESYARKYMTVDREYEDLLKALRAALSHKMPGATEFEILKECMRRTLKDEEKKQGIVDEPRADRGKGGAGTPDNVILLCQKHNLLAAEIAWGEEHINRFRRRTREQATETLQSQLDLSGSQ